MWHMLSYCTFSTTITSLTLSLWVLYVICSGIITPYRCPDRAVRAKQDEHFECNTNSPRRGEISRRSAPSRTHPPHLSPRLARQFYTPWTHIIRRRGLLAPSLLVQSTNKQLLSHFMTLLRIFLRQKYPYRSCQWRSLRTSIPYVQCNNRFWKPEISRMHLL